MHANTSCPSLPLRPRPAPISAPATAVGAGEPVRIGRVPPQASWRVPRSTQGNLAVPGCPTLALPGAGHGGGSAGPTPMPPPPQRQAALRPCSPGIALASPPYTPTPSAAQLDELLWATPPDTAQALTDATRRMGPISPGPAARFLSAWTYANGADGRSGPEAGTPSRLGPLRSPGMREGLSVYGTKQGNSPTSGNAPPLNSPAWEPGASSPTGEARRDPKADGPATVSVFSTPQAQVAQEGDGSEASAAEGSPASSAGSSNASSFGCPDAARIERARR